MTPLLPAVRQRPAVGVAMVLCSATLFAVNGTASKLILRAGVDPPRLTTLRATGACLGLLLLSAMVPPGGRRLRVTRRELPLLFGYGIAGFFLVPMLYFVGIGRLPVGISLLFEFTAPMFIALWIRFGRRQPVRPRLWVGLAASLAGLAGVAEIWHTSGWSGRALPGRAAGAHLDPLGVAAALAAAVLLALYYVLGAHGVTRRDPLSLTSWAFGVAAVAGSLVRPWWSFPYHVFVTSSGGVPVWLLALYLVCGGSIAPFLLSAAALRHLPPTSVGIIAMVEPVVASAVAWTVLGERLAPVQLAGGALVLFGVALAETARTVGPAGASPASTPAGEPAGEHTAEQEVPCIPT
ncbi:MAG: EamA family transporter [Micromonosporaceae bacterium]|nr:EamA family transporter [Micromonosporaceae bacterium]